METERGSIVGDTKMSDVVAMIQARMGSKRLPGKVLMDIEGKTMLERVVERVSQSKLVDCVLVATSTDESDTAIRNTAREHRWDYFCGDEEDVLARLFQGATQPYAVAPADVIVRITADCPLIDPHVIDQTVSLFLMRYPDIDYGSNILPRTFPRGLDVEVLRLATLRNEYYNCVKWREHVTAGIRANPSRYRTCNKASDHGNHSNLRWTVDTPEDLNFVRKVYAHLGGEGGIPDFSWLDVLHLLEEHPDWRIRDKQKEPWEQGENGE